MIKNAKDTLLSNQSGTLPNVSSAMNGWFQPMVFIALVKTVVNSVVVETPTPINFRGVWQLMSAEKLQIKPERMRDWRWFTVHSDTDLSLNSDDRITYKNVKYRVMDKNDYELYGYYQYDLVEDYDGA